MMKTRFLAGAATAALALAAAPASAMSLGTWTGSIGNGVDLDGYVGEGIPAGNMAIDTDPTTGISVGLKSIHRYVGDWAPATFNATSGRYEYRALPGVGQINAAGDLDPTGEATKWSYTVAWDFGDADTANYGIRYRLDFSPADGEVASGDWYEFTITPDSNPLPAQDGDSQSMGFDWYGDVSDGTNDLLTSEGTDTGLDITFAGTANYQDIDVFAAGRYDVDVEIFDLTSGDVIAGSAISIIVVPLPPAAFAGLAGLAGVAMMRHRLRSAD